MKRGERVGARGTVSRTLGCLARVGVVVWASGCGSNDPNKPLTVNQGASLMRDVRKDPSKTQNLSPAEKAYLQQQLKR